MVSERDLREYATVGVKSFSRRTFKFELTGREVYELIKILEELAVKGQNFIEIRKVVLTREVIDRALRGQGYYADNLDDEDRSFIAARGDDAETESK